jgi:hypothetical protein
LDASLGCIAYPVAKKQKPQKIKTQQSTQNYVQVTFDKDVSEVQ